LLFRLYNYCVKNLQLEEWVRIVDQNFELGLWIRIVSQDCGSG